MDNKSRDIENLITQSIQLREISKVKHNLEETLKELTVCSNVAVLTKKQKIFNEKVLEASCRVVGSFMPSQDCCQTLVITIKNVSETLAFNCKYWQFCINLNDKTQSTWTLESSLAPGKEDKFCCPLSKTLPIEKVKVSLKFVIQFESKTYTRSFVIRDFVIDMLYCLDPGAIFSECSENSLHGRENVNFFVKEQPGAIFPSITKFMIRVDNNLKEKLAHILLRDSVHRGFSDSIDELSKSSEISVFFEGCKIEMSISSKSDLVAIKCVNPSVLCAVKASILRRLVTVEGIGVESLDDDNLEKIQRIKLKLASFDSDCDSDAISVDSLMELYLELRDISESIRYTAVHVVE